MNQSFFKRQFFWYGIYFGIASILIFVIEYFVFPQLLSDKIASTLISIVPVIVFMVLAGFAERKENGGYLTFGKTFRTMFFTALIGIVLFSVFSYLFTKYYAPEYLKDLMEKQMQETRIKLEDKGMSDEDIDKAMKMSESFIGMQDSFIFRIFGIALGAGFAALMALLAALFVRKEPPLENFSQYQNLESDN